MNQEQIIQEIEQLAQVWTVAEVRGETSFLEQLLTDDFIGVGPLGFLLSKQSWIERHQSGDLQYTSIDLCEVTVRVYQESAILIGRLAQQGIYRGNPINAQFRTALVFVKFHGHWQLANSQVSALGQPPNFVQAMPVL